jgi:hypothetical protein
LSKAVLSVYCTFKKCKDKRYCLTERGDICQRAPYLRFMRKKDAGEIETGFPCET